jgi:hypothetical protein
MATLVMPNTTPVFANAKGMGNNAPPNITRHRVNAFDIDSGGDAFWCDSEEGTSSHAVPRERRAI